MQLDVSTVMAPLALAVSGLSFYRGYIYTRQDLEITVTEMSYVTNQGELYMSIAFSNGGNRDAEMRRFCVSSRLSGRQTASQNPRGSRWSTGSIRIFR